MHIKVHTSHRHFLAAPIAMGILMISSFGGVLTASLHGPDINWASESDFHTLPSHTQVLPLEGSSFQQNILEEGSVLVRTEGLAHLRAGDANIYGLNGGFHVVRYADSLSVSALTGPVLLEKNGTRMIVPVGWMWSGDVLTAFEYSYDSWLDERELQSIPDRFFETQMHTLRTFPDVVSILPGASILPKALRSSSFLFGDAQEREMTRWTEEVLGAVVSALQKEDTVSMRAILDDSTYTAAFTTERGQEVLTILLSHIGGTSSVDSAILEILSDNTQLSLLASIHPHTRASAWTMTHAYSDEDDLLRLISFPFSDVLSEGESDFTVQRWEQSILAKAKAMKDPIPFIEALVDTVSPLIESHYHHAYPKRAQQLTKFLQVITENYRSLLSAQTKSTVLKLALLDRVEWEMQSEKNDVPTSEVVLQQAVDVEFNPEEVEQYAYEHLRDAGALFTVETTVKGVAPNIAEVRAVLFGGATHDVSANFSYNVLNHQMTDLVVDETVYPNAIGIVKFSEWVKGL